MSKIDPALFAAREQALDKAYRSCPECGSALIVRNGKHGPFLGCSSYPECGYVRPLASQGVTVEKLLAGSICPDCGHELAIKKGRYGLFIGCTQYPLCQHVEHEHQAPVDNVACPACHNGTLVARTSRQGKQFFACDHYPACKYILNDRPVAQSCPVCGWPVLTVRQSKDGERLVCPQKLCQFESDL